MNHNQTLADTHMATFRNPENNIPVAKQVGGPERDARGHFLTRKDDGMYWWVPLEYYIKYTAIGFITILLFFSFWIVVLYLFSTEAYYRRWTRSW